MGKSLVLSVLVMILQCSLLLGEDNKDKETLELEQARKTFKRHMEFAHPTKMLKGPVSDIKVPILQDESIDLFLNVNTIDPETGINTSQLMQNESSVAVNPLNTKNLIASAVDYRDTSAAWVYVSHDGGKSWDNLKLGRPYPGWRSSNDPSVAFDHDGVGYMVYGAFGTFDETTQQLVGENGVFMAKTTDQGYTWKAHIPIIVHKGVQSLDSTFEDKYYITIDNSPSSPYYKHLYIPWKRMFARDSATQVVLSKSTDKGESWSVPVPVSAKIGNTSEDTTYGQSFPLTACGPNGEVYAVWNHGTVHGVGFAVSTDGGLTFSAPKVIQKYEIFGTTRDISTDLEYKEYRHTLKGKVRAESYPVIASDIREGSRKGYLYLCWAGGNVPDIFFARSTDGGNNWSTPVVVHSDKDNDQFWPWMNVDPINGDIMISYFDSRNDTSNLLVECFVSYSSDAGLTWIDRRAADFSHDISKNPFYGHFAGDYSGLAFYDGIGYPTWVDMRNVLAPSYTDSDVYTAVVNTKVPAPPDELAVITLPDEPTKLKLKWKPVYEKCFGQPVNPDLLSFGLFRDSKFLATLPGSSTEYFDEGLTYYNKYHYSLYAIIASDTSMPAIDSGFAGGSKTPGAPSIVSWSGSDNNEVTLNVKLPVLREDEVTPLVNLANVSLYRNNVFIKDIQVSAEDTGKTVPIKDLPGKKGWYMYKVAAKDNSQPPNISTFSGEQLLFTGAVPGSVTEGFEGADNTSWNENKWGITAAFSKSGTHSLTDSPSGNYDNNKSNSTLLFPVSIKEESTNISFWHAAIVDRKDSCFFEYSVDSGNTWTLLGKYNELDYEYWQDKTLEQSDWKYESFTMPLKDSEVVFRFRIASNLFTNRDGWYIDDFSVTPATAVAGDGQSASPVIAYPNPASDWLYINIPDNLSGQTPELTISDLYGRQLVSGNKTSFDGKRIRIDLQDNSNGTYYVNIKFDNTIFRLNFLIAR